MNATFVSSVRVAVGTPSVSSVAKQPDLAGSSFADVLASADSDRDIKFSADAAPQSDMRVGDDSDVSRLDERGTVRHRSTGQDRAGRSADKVSERDSVDDVEQGSDVAVREKNAVEPDSSDVGLDTPERVDARQQDLDPVGVPGQVNVSSQPAQPPAAQPLAALPARTQLTSAEVSAAAAPVLTTVAGVTVAGEAGAAPVAGSAGPDTQPNTKQAEVSQPLPSTQPATAQGSNLSSGALNQQDPVQPDVLQGMSAALAGFAALEPAQISLSEKRPTGQDGVAVGTTFGQVASFGHLPAQSTPSAAAHLARSETSTLVAGSLQGLDGQVSFGGFSSGVSTAEMTVDLSDEGLGKLTVSAAVAADGLHVKLTTSDVALRDLIKERGADLRREFEQSGTQLGSFDVSTRGERQPSQHEANRPSRTATLTNLSGVAAAPTSTSPRTAARSVIDSTSVDVWI